MRVLVAVGIRLDENKTGYCQCICRIAHGAEYPAALLGKHAGYARTWLLRRAAVLSGLILNQMEYMAGRNTKVRMVPANVPPISV